MRRLLIWGGGGLAALAGMGVIALWWVLLRDLPDLDALADYRPSLTSTVVDRNGEPIGEFFEERRQLTVLHDVPKIVVQAFLAAEDDTFYQHRGVDYSSLVRAALAVVMAGGEKVQGGSTITQQIVLGAPPDVPQYRPGLGRDPDAASHTETGPGHPRQRRSRPGG